MWQDRGVVLERKKKSASTSVPGDSAINTLNTLGCNCLENLYLINNFS